MEITLEIDDAVMNELELEAARQGVTTSQLVETAFCSFFQEHEPTKKLPPLPTFSSGGMFVDPANRDELYRMLEEE
jgi:hypothetical protein